MAIRINKIKEMEERGEAIDFVEDAAFIKRQEERNKRMQELRRELKLKFALGALDAERIILNT